MASYHLCIHPPVSRGKGQSIAATAAYNGRTRLVDERTGEVHDYRHLGATLFSGIYAPKDVPDWARDLQQLVTEIERTEKRSDSQLAFNIDIALPHELSLEQNRRLIQDFAREEWQRKGYAVIVDIHAPDPEGDQRNIHAHVWGTLRKLGKDGFAATKAEQQDNYRNRSEYTEYLREKWEKLANRHLERAGVDAAIDRRSLKDQGILDREPEQHHGPQLTVIDRDGRESHIKEEIRRRQAQLAELRRLQAEERQLQVQIIDLQAQRAEREARASTKGQVDDIRPPGAERTQQTGDKSHSRDAADRPEPGQRRRQPESEAMAFDMTGESERAEQAKMAERQRIAYFDMIAEKERADRFLQNWQHDHDQGERHRRTLQQDQFRLEAEGDLADPRTRALIAAGESRDFLQTVRREGAMMTQEHNELERAIALEDDPDKKQLLIFKRDIQHADYMAITTERIAAMSNLNSEQHQEAQHENEAWTKIGTDLRKERLDLQERMADREMDIISQAVERINDADRMRADFRADIRGTDQPETVREAAQAQETPGRANAAATAETRASEPERPAEVIYLEPNRPERENTDARQSSSAETTEITDAKAAKHAALAQLRAETEQSIAQAQDRGHEHSR